MARHPLCVLERGSGRSVEATARAAQDEACRRAGGKSNRRVVGATLGDTELDRIHREEADS